MCGGVGGGGVGGGGTLQLSAREVTVVENASISFKTVSCFFSRAFRGGHGEGKSVRRGGEMCVRREREERGEERGRGEWGR